VSELEKIDSEASKSVLSSKTKLIAKGGKGGVAATDDAAATKDYSGASKDNAGAGEKVVVKKLIPTSLENDLIGICRALRSISSIVTELIATLLPGPMNVQHAILIHIVSCI
jgi:hypothetical protein